MDLNPLHEAVIGNRGLASGDWDIAFMATDWLAEAQTEGLLEDLTPHMTRAPIPDFPDAWSPSLTTMQRFAGGFCGMPYHDGPERLIYRKDLLAAAGRSEEHTSELQSLMRISYAVFCLKKKTQSTMYI